MNESGGAEPSTFEFFIEFGTEHTAMGFDKLMVKLNEIRAREDYTIINEINMRTKASIVQSILGLGHIYRQQGFIELRNLPHIVNLLETELRFHHLRMTHKTRGQHPAGPAGTNQWADEDTEIMMAQVPPMEERMNMPIPVPFITIVDESEEEIIS